MTLKMPGAFACFSYSENTLPQCGLQHVGLNYSKGFKKAPAYRCTILPLEHLTRARRRPSVYTTAAVGERRPTRQSSESATAASGSPASADPLLATRRPRARAFPSLSPALQRDRWFTERQGRQPVSGATGSRFAYRPQRARSGQQRGRRLSARDRRSRIPPASPEGLPLLRLAVCQKVMVMSAGAMCSSTNVVAPRMPSASGTGVSDVTSKICAAKLQA